VALSVTPAQKGAIAGAGSLPGALLVVETRSPVGLFFLVQLPLIGPTALTRASTDTRPSGDDPHSAIQASTCGDKIRPSVTSTVD
jgi:hypothetical protein